MYSTIDGEFWIEYRNLSIYAKITYLYLFSNPNRTNIGLYNYDSEVFASLIKIKEIAFKNALIELKKENLIDYDNKYVWIKGLFKRQPKNDKQIIRFKRELEKIKSPLAAKFVEKYKSLNIFPAPPVGLLSDAGSIPTPMVVSSIIKKENKDINKKDREEIINHLNQKVKRNFQQDNKLTIKLINTRFKEGYKLEDFLKVIETKYNEWINTEYDKFLVPKTLFSDKFDTYINQEKKPPKEKTYYRKVVNGEIDKNLGN